MEGKRAAARRDRADDRGCDHRDVAAQRAGAAEAGRRAQAAADGARRRAEARERTADVIAAMRSLGCRMDEARRAAELSEAIPDASLEQRVRRALTYFVPAHCRRRSEAAESTVTRGLESRQASVT